MRQISLAFLAIFAFTHLAEAAEKPLKVVICAGQSNMLGKRSRAPDLPTDLQGAQKNLFFDGSSWVSLTPGIGQTEGFGPEVSFASEFSKLIKEPIGIIKHSKGGTNLDGQWRPDRDLYKGLLDKVIAAQKSRKIEIVGMIWMQGESDAMVKGAAERYATNLVNFIKSARRDFNSPDMIFIAGRINSFIPKCPCTDVVRKAIEECKAPKYAYIDCDTLEKGPDKLHYTTKGIVEMGNRFAAAIVQEVRELDKVFRGPIPSSNKTGDTVQATLSIGNVTRTSKVATR